MRCVYDQQLQPIHFSMTTKEKREDFDCNSHKCDNLITQNNLCIALQLLLRSISTVAQSSQKD